MNQLLHNHHAKPVVSQANAQSSLSILYLVHHCVTRKFRVVFNGAANFGGGFLNSVLFKGPDHTNSLVRVQLHFWVGPIAVMANIQSMFLQCLVP